MSWSWSRAIIAMMGTLERRGGRSGAAARYAYTSRLLRLGVRGLSENIDAVMVLPVDMPLARQMVPDWCMCGRALSVRPMVGAATPYSAGELLHK